MSDDVADAEPDSSGESLFEVPAGFWDEPAPLPDSVPPVAEFAASRAAANETEVEPDSPLALVQQLFPGRVLAVDRPAELSSADSSADELLTDDPSLAENGDASEF